MGFLGPEVAKNYIDNKWCRFVPVNGVLGPLKSLKKVGKVSGEICIIVIDGLCEAEQHRWAFYQSWARDNNKATTRQRVKQLHWPEKVRKMLLSRCHNRFRHNSITNNLVAWKLSHVVAAVLSRAQRCVLHYFVPKVGMQVVNPAAFLSGSLWRGRIIIRFVLYSV